MLILPGSAPVESSGQDWTRYEAMAFVSSFLLFLGHLRGLCGPVSLEVLEECLTASLLSLEPPFPALLRPRAVLLINRLKITPMGFSLSTGMVFVLAYMDPVVLPTPTACDIVRGLEV